MSNIRIITRRTSNRYGKGYAFDICDAVTHAITAGKHAHNAEPIVTSTALYPTRAVATQAATRLAESLRRSVPEGTPSEDNPHNLRHTFLDPVTERAKTTRSFDHGEREYRARIAPGTGGNLAANTAADPYPLAVHIFDMVRRRQETLDQSPLFEMFHLSDQTGGAAHYTPSDWSMLAPTVEWRLLDDLYQAQHLTDTDGSSEDKLHRLIKKAGTIAHNGDRPIRCELFKHHYLIQPKQLVWLLFTQQYAPRIHLRDGLAGWWTPQSVHIGAARPKHWT